MITVHFPMIGDWYESPKSPFFLVGFNSMSDLTQNLNSEHVGENHRLFIINVNKEASVNNNVVYEALVYTAAKESKRLFFEIECADDLECSVLKTMLRPLF